MAIIGSNLIQIAISALLYALLFGINELLFSNLSFSDGVSWIFLPAGFRLVLTLLLGLNGAIGISLSSILLGVFFFFSDDLLTAILAGTLGGLAPYIALKLVFKNLALDQELFHLDGGKLLNCIFIYALISSFLHQILFYMTGYTEHFIETLGVMLIGDLLGTFAIIYLVKLLIKLANLKN
ncbi:MAG: hypothetical protein RIS03_1099 [Pseudomonadota bacterium]